MQEWERRQRHHEQVTKTLMAGGEMDISGRLRSWKGKDSLARLAAVGHSAVGYEQCDCRKAAEPGSR